MGWVLELWGVLLYVGLRNWGRRSFDPRWLFLLIWVVVTPLPLNFLPTRGPTQFYLVLPGYAMLAAMTVRALAQKIARQPVAGLSRAATTSLFLFACIGVYLHETWRADQRLIPYFLSNGEESQIAMQKLASTGILPARNSRVAFLNDPFPGQLDMLFISALCWKDRTLAINLQQTYHLPPEELAKVDYILDYADGRFVVLKP